MMNYHDITTDDMKNGDGLRTVLWVAGCRHRCKGCHNSITWDPNGGIPFDDRAKQELMDDLSADYISGLTLSGGDPLFPSNISTITALCRMVKLKFPGKTIWLYTGYLWEDIICDELTQDILRYIDVLVDGTFDETLADVNYPWGGSTNQRVIDVQASLQQWNKNRRLQLHETV